MTGTFSNLTSVTDANYNQTTYSVDDFGQTYQIDSPATGTTKLTYNEAGQATLKEDARTSTATHTYDAAGRLEVSVYEGLSIIETITTTYDANGRRTTADTGDLFETWSYDRRGLTIFSSREKEWMGDTVLEEASFVYSEDGALDTITYPSGRHVSYGVDHAGRPVSVSATGPGGSGGFNDYVSDVSYLPFGPADAVTYPLLGGGTTDNRPHDQRYRLTSQNPGLAEPLRSYTYDLASNLLTADNPAPITDEVYTYDDMGRLETASGAFGAISYGYDPIGNLLSRDAVGGPDPGVMDLFYVNGTSPLVERVETTPEGQGMIIHDIVHDLMGNILDDGVSRYFWDPRPIMRFHKQGGTSAYYRYSDYTADGIMCARRAYTVDPVVYYAQMVTLDSPSGQRLSERIWNMDFEVFGGRELVWLGDRLIASFDITASDPGYVFTDHIGYPVMVMDSSANTLWSSVHEPYGEAVLTGGTTADDPLLRYPGQWKDDPAFVVTDPPQRNLFANGYRWYNPDWGRYTQSDPIGLNGGLNTYAYAEQNPLLFVDPFGLDVWVCSRRSRQGPGNHAYFWDDRQIPSSQGPNWCGMSASGWRGDPRGWQSNWQGERGPGLGGDACNLVPDSGGHEDELMDCCRGNANAGIWFPWINDCHNALEDCTEEAGLDYPGAPGGRLGPPECDEDDPYCWQPNE